MILFEKTLPWVIDSVFRQGGSWLTPRFLVFVGNLYDNHKVDMLPVHQVAVLMNEAREENLALRMQIRASRPEIIPSAPEDRYKVI